MDEIITDAPKLQRGTITSLSTGRNKSFVRILTSLRLGAGFVG